MKFADWWGKVVFFFLCVSIVVVGVGGVETFGGFNFPKLYRRIFPFWLVWKPLVWIQHGHKSLEWHKLLPPLPLLFFFVFVTASLLPDFELRGDYRRFLFAFLHYMMVADLFSHNKRPRYLLCLLGIVPGFLLVRGILYDPSVLNLNQMIRFEYPLDHANTAGYLFSMGIPLTLVVFINEKGWLRALGGFSLMAQFGGLILTYSRGAWLGCFASLLFLALIQKNLRKILVIVGIIGFILVVASSSLQSRLWSLTKEMGHPDILWRFQVMINAISLGVENPLLGVGYGGDHLRAALQERYPEFSNQRYVHHSHNVYTEILAGTGFLGLGAFLWLLGSTLVRLFQKGRSELVEEKRLLYFCLFASLLAFIIAGLGDVPFYHHETSLYFFNLLALIYIHLRAARPL